MDLDTDLRFSLSINNNKNVDKSVVKVIPVNKLALASISGYFKNLFFDKLSEQCSLNANYFDIKEEANFDWKAFELMVYSIMAMRLMIHESEMLTDNLAMKILKLSIKYDIPMMQNYCEQYLIKSETFSKMELLEIGDQLRLEKLMENALAAITLLDFSKDFDKNSEIRARLSEKTTKLLDKKLEKKANEWKEFVARK